MRNSRKERKIRSGREKRRRGEQARNRGGGRGGQRHKHGDIDMENRRKNREIRRSGRGAS
jgi:hypothetical protein